MRNGIINHRVHVGGVRPLVELGSDHNKTIVLSPYIKRSRKTTVGNKPWDGSPAIQKISKVGGTVTNFTNTMNSNNQRITLPCVGGVTLRQVFIVTTTSTTNAGRTGGKDLGVRNRG